MRNLAHRQLDKRGETPDEFTMLLVRTYIAPSPIHGAGLFAAEPITKGTEIWRYLEGFDPVYPSSILVDGPGLARLYLKRHAYPHHSDHTLIMLDGDDCRYMNHSSDPNVIFPYGQVTGHALCDIAPGTELLCNYEEFASGWYDI